MEFWVNLIRLKGHQSAEAKKSIEGNCTHIIRNFYFFEGEIEALEEDGVQCVVLGEGAVGSLGGLSKKRLVEIAGECIGVDVLSKIKV